MSVDKKRKLPEGLKWEMIENHISNSQSRIACGDKSRKVGYPHLRMNNISNNMRLDLKFLWRIPATENEIRSYFLQKGDILFNNTNSDDLVGKSCLYDIDSNETFLFSNHLTRIRTKNTLNAKYLLYWINLLWQKQYFKYNYDKWVNQAAVRVKDLLFPFSFPFPPTFTDQLAIASDLERRMAHVDKMRGAALRQKEAVAATHGAILREVFSYEEGDELPEGWKLRPLKENCFINPSKRKGFTREPNPQTSFVPMEAVDEETGKIAHIINRNYFEISKGYTFFEDGDVLFAKITPCMQNGKSAIAQDLIDGVGFGSTEFHVLRPKKDVTKEWIYFYIRTVEFRKRAKDHFEGSAGQQRVSTDFIENSLIPLPPTLSDQIAIVAELERKMAELEKARQAAERQLKAIKMLPGAILREVFDFEEENTGA